MSQERCRLHGCEKIPQCPVCQAERGERCLGHGTLLAQRGPTCGQEEWERRGILLSSLTRELQEAAGMIEEARHLVGRLMFRYAGGVEGEGWRAEAPWVAEAEQQARKEWERDHARGA